MAESTRANLLRLSDTELTVAEAAEDVRGYVVLDRGGEETGHVDDLMLDDKEHKVRFLQVASGGFLGLGERKFLIPVDAVTRIHDNHVNIDQTREYVAGSPEYDPKVVPEPTYYDSLYGYYGHSPFWAPGYVYPPYPVYKGMA